MVLKAALLQILPGEGLKEQFDIGAEACRKAKGLGADIALFPEMWSDGYDIPQNREELKKLAISADSEFVTGFGRLAKELDMAIGITFLEKYALRPRNSIVLYDRHGERQFLYAKVHTCDFGDERMLSAGEDFYVTELDTACGPVKVGCMICYDREFPESARILMLKGAELVLVPNACPMEINRLSQLRGRAYENMMGIATCNYPEGKPDCNGHSSAFDGVAYLPEEEGSRDMCIMEADGKPGIYLAEFDLDMLREYRRCEVHGNAYRHPEKYGLLVSREINEPFEILKNICREFNLGELRYEPCSLTGGFLHSMYSLFTTKGSYAVKLLNPYVMQRENVMDNYRTAEELESMLEENDIPILSALIVNGRKMHRIDGRFFYLYEWYDGKALKSNEVKESHCRQIGNVLARIHNLYRKNEGYSRSELHIDWDDYIRRFAVENKEISHLLEENRDLLYESQKNGNAAVKKLPHVTAVCHNDMDCKNVLWMENDFRIIDLECLCYSSPFLELYETALCWAGYAEGHIDYELLRAFMDSYINAGGETAKDWETVYWSNYGRLEWLEYNMKRALGIECLQEEIRTGISEVKNTVAQVIYYHKEKDNILNCLRSVQ